MATVKEVITDALEEINYLAAEEPITKADGNTAMRYLNDMLTMWDILGISIVFTKVSNLGEQVTVADGALYGIKKLLAISLGPKFDATITPVLLKEAKIGWDAILNLGVSIRPTRYASTLPIGSGNYCHTHRNSIFYPDVDEAIYTETNGYIATEDNNEVE